MKNGQELEQAVEQLKNGKEEAFCKIYALTYHFVYSRARQAINDEQEALDLLQEVYVAAYQNIKSLREAASLYAWLGSITLRQGAKMANKMKNQVLLSEENIGMFEELPETSAGPEDSLMERQKAEILKEIIGELPPPQKSAVIAYYYDGLKVEEIAGMTETSKGTIMSRLYLARKYMKEAIREREKKSGCVLHSFSIPTMVYALKLLLNETVLPKEAAQTVYYEICRTLGIQAGKLLLAGNAAVSMKDTANAVKVENGLVKREGMCKMMNQMLQKVLGLGKAKLAAIAIGTVAVIGAGVGTGIYLHHQNQVQEAEAQAQEKEEKEAEERKKAEEQEEAQKQKNIENLSMRTQALREKLQEVIVTEEEYQSADADLKKLETAVKEKKDSPDLFTFADSLEKTMETYIQKSAQYLLEKEIPLAVTDISAWEQTRLTTFQGIKTEYDGLKNERKYKSADGKLDLLLAELTKETGTQVAGNTDVTGTGEETGTSGKNNQSQAGTGTSGSGVSQSAGGTATGSTGGNGSGSNAGGSVSGGNQASAPEETPAQPETPKEPEKPKNAADSWSWAEEDALSEICAKWVTYVYDDAEAQAQLVSRLPGRTCTLVHYPPERNGEAKALWNSIDRQVYVCTAIATSDTDGAWFIYAK